MGLWPHQQRGLEQIAADIRSGYQRIVNAAPTGSGKSLIMEKILEWGEPAALFTDRRFLMEQLARGLRESGFQFGIRASGYDVNVLPPIQLCMVQTEHSRVIEAEEREHHKAKLVLLDEAHRLRGDMMKALLDRHLEDGAVVIGFTATPIGLGPRVETDQDGNETHVPGLYDKLNVLSTNRECIRIGALVPAKTYSPSMPDLQDLEPKRRATGEYPTEEMTKKYARPEIFGDVYRHWRRLNPHAEPTILFGPDVDGSMYFHDKFHEKGVSVAHIDGERVVINGEPYESSAEVREQMMADYEAGDITLVCNRFVMREGINAPFIRHLIFANAFGSLQAYLQAGGRVLRNHPSMEDVIVQDHGGNALRHGSLNADRHWELDDTEQKLRKQREEALRNDKEPEPIVCPNCFKERESGPECPECGHRSTRKSRVVIQRDGTLREYTGDFYKPRKRSQQPQEVQDWKACLFRCANSKKRTFSFNQAMGLFAREHGGRYPNTDWPLVPQSELDGMRKVTRDAISDIAKMDAQEKRAQRDANSLFAGGKV